MTTAGQNGFELIRDSDNQISLGNYIPFIQVGRPSGIRPRNDALWDVINIGHLVCTMLAFPRERSLWTSRLPDCPADPIPITPPSILSKFRIPSLA